MSADVSVVVCIYTARRWADILAGVRSLSVQTLAPREVLIVVDHNDELLEKAEAELASNLVRVLASTGNPGLSGARNTGVAAATGAIVAFLDDDACPDTNWLERLVAPFAADAVMVTGGRAIAAWPDDRPAWFPEEFDWVVGSAYRGMPTRTSDVRNVLGSSMAVRASAFASVGTFTEGLGRVGTLPLGCEETELCIRIQQANPGARVVYVPESVVHHRVSDDRLAFRYFARRCLAEGASKAQISAIVGAGDATASERTYVVRALPAGVARGLIAAAKGDLDGVRRAAAIVAGLTLTVLGYLRGALGHSPRLRVSG